MEFQNYDQAKELTADFLRSVEFPTYFPPIDEYFFPEANGICLNGTHHLTEHESMEHSIICGKTGTGKSTKVIIPTCERVSGSQIIHDSSGELTTILSDSFKNRGYQIWILDFSDPINSIQWNPLIQLQSQDDIPLLAKLLVQSTRQGNKGGNDEHWLDKATALVTSLLHLVYRFSVEDRTLGNAYRILQETILDSSKVEKMYEEYNVPTPYLLTFRAMMKNKTSELSSIMSTATRSLFPFSYENRNAFKITSGNTVDLKDLRITKTVLFIKNSPNRSEMFHKLISILFEQIWLVTMEELPNPTDNALYFIIDEASSLFFPSLGHRIDKARKYKLSILLAYQSLDQIELSYPDKMHKVVRDNCVSQIYIGAHEGETAAQLEEAIGRYKAPGVGMLYPRKTREEIRTWSKDTTLVLRSGVVPLLTKNTPYQENEFYNYLPRWNDNMKLFTKFCNEAGCWIPV